MGKSTKGTVEGYRGLPVSFHLRKAVEGSRKLAILLPGLGYTAEAPVLHYARKSFLLRSFDVLEINYRYDSEAYSGFSQTEIVEAVQFDAKAVIDEVLSSNSYEDYHLIGKSLGTIAAASELKRADFKFAKAIWLTPLLHREDVYFAVATCHHTSLLFMGDKDPYYHEGRFTQLQHNPNITFHLIPGVGHSLEYPDQLSGSIEVLGNVIKEIDAF
ncbi:alpha/beta hydrolase [Planococcus salinus]|uniref:Alpha/beta hydrolase n=1 Tax=Planococcus salinus TaxID=1848460 RepID=A0A3M8P306_9BACL|nr:alpha/beta hydrolase [Planococcus salinus]RNF38117.1 alpha/beta hydrolase [Planococcus salinus]